MTFFEGILIYPPVDLPKAKQKTAFAKNKKMAAIAIALAIITCLQGAVKIVQSFKTEVCEQITGSGHGNGFWDFYSFSTVDTMTIKMEKVPTYINKYLISKVFAKTTSANLLKYKDEICDYLEALADFEGYEVETAQKNVNTISYSNNDLTLFFYITTFTPISTTHVRCENMRLETEGIKLAQDWMIVNTISSNMLKVKNVVEHRYIAASLTNEKIVQAIAIAFAPVSLGLVKVPTGFLEAMQEVIKNTNATDLPQPYTSEQLKYAQETYDAMIKRQTERDNQTIEGLKVIGEGVASLK